MATLFIIDHHEPTRQALSQRLSRVTGITVLGMVGSSREGIAQSRALHPDVVLLEPKLSDGRGLDVLRAIRADNPSTRVIVLTSYGDDLEQRAALKAGAECYLLKDIDTEKLVEVILGQTAGPLERDA